MERKRRPLSARRHIETTPGFEPAVNEFMRTPIRLDPEPDYSPKNFSARGGDDLFRTRPTTTISENYSVKDYISDHLYDGRRRAFEIAHERRAKAAKRQLDRQWEESERMRKWNARKVHKNIEPKRVQKDQKILESIIAQRNEYYINSSKADQLPLKLELSARRPLPKEVRAVAQDYERPQTARRYK